MMNGVEMQRRFYESIAGFYRADRRREISGERDFGVHWKPIATAYPGDTARVSLVIDTGELYAEHHRGRGVQVLAHFDRDSRDAFWQRAAQEAYRRGVALENPPPKHVLDDALRYRVEHALRGWEEWCTAGEPGWYSLISAIIRAGAEPR